MASPEKTTVKGGLLVAFLLYVNVFFCGKSDIDGSPGDGWFAPDPGSLAGLNTSSHRMA